jgi:hypothetical protein
MSDSRTVSRRCFLNQSLAVAGSAAVVAAAGAEGVVQAAMGETAGDTLPSNADLLPCATIGKAKISRLMLGGNLIAGFMHSRDLKYVNSLFRAYVTEEKILETLKVAEEHGINTLFESGWEFVERYNREYHGHMQFIPHIKVEIGQSAESLDDQVKHLVDAGAVALYVWGVAADTLVMSGKAEEILKAVEIAKKHGLPVGVGGHSLQVPMQCEKLGVPCDFYVKTLHSDDYPSATPKEHRREFMWMANAKKADGKSVWYDNMWCINPEDTIEFMRTVTKPWVAYKVLAAGAFLPRQGFSYAFKNGADLIAVGMLDFQIKEDCGLAEQIIRHYQQRERPWRA